MRYVNGGNGLAASSERKTPDASHQAIYIILPNTEDLAYLSLIEEREYIEGKMSKQCSNTGTREGKEEERYMGRGDASCEL